MEENEVSFSRSSCHWQKRATLTVVGLQHLDTFIQTFSMLGRNAHLHLNEEPLITPKNMPNRYEWETNAMRKMLKEIFNPHLYLNKNIQIRGIS